MIKLRLAIFLIVLAFSVTLAVIVGLRLSDQAMAVVVGVIAGVAASIPTSLIVVWIATRQVALTADRRDRAAEREPEPPRVIVVQSPPASAHPYDPRYSVPPPPSPAGTRGRRAFTIIGGDDE